MRPVILAEEMKGMPSELAEDWDSLPDGSWMQRDRDALDSKIHRALEAVTIGRVFGQEEAKRRLAAMRAARLDARRPGRSEDLEPSK